MSRMSAVHVYVLLGSILRFALNKGTYVLLRGTFWRETDCARPAKPLGT